MQKGSRYQGGRSDKRERKSKRPHRGRRHPILAGVAPQDAYASYWGVSHPPRKETCTNGGSGEGHSSINQPKTDHPGRQTLRFEALLRKNVPRHLLVAPVLFRLARSPVQRRCINLMRYTEIHGQIGRRLHHPGPVDRLFFFFLSCA
ncbi:unnamed protein product [Periconia digitata]|uniref:Uncharacterized protein n=1 Tax=Periconia digitata TaxID=1303443 RepID=A0A9W4U4S4_9PLEO|nr:unnamed protein product [Periconia digitata]